jgi:beta-lactamase regulating signal transducer with metallopeptidase domain/type II secretory pathway component GspD/PulD (secretin)/protein involved in polysaccharide export with SLBB domain
MPAFLQAALLSALPHNRFIEALGWTLLLSLWLLSAIAAVAALVLVVLRRTGSNLRYLVACAALLLMPAALVVTFARMLPGPPAVPTAAAPVAFTPSAAPAPALPDATVFIERPVVVSPPQLPWQTRVQQTLRPHLPTAVGVYFAGLFLMALRLAVGYSRLRLLTARATPLYDLAATLHRLAVRMGIHSPIRLLASSAIEVPTLLGALKPLILLPAAALAGLSTAQLEALLAHELAHIRRHDYLANLLQSLLETAFFYHPAVWWLSARIRQERENCCDDAVVALTGDRLTYARALTTMESLRPAAAPALAARGGALLPRIRRLLGLTPAPRRLLTTTTAGLLVTLLAALIYIGCSQTTTVNPSQPPTSMAAGTGPIQVHMKLYFVPSDTLRDAIAQAIIKPQSPGAPTTASATFDASDPATLQRFLRVIESDKQTKHLSSPTFRLTSGQEGKLDLTSAPKYIESFPLPTGSAVAGQDPTPNGQVGTIKTGVEVAVTATVQNDRRILTTIHPKVTTFDGMDTIPQTQEKTPADGPPKPPYTQLPRITTTECQLTASIPDGGTLLILGPSRTIEQEVQTSTPMLSQIPGMGRMFTNHSYRPTQFTLVTVVQPAIQPATSQPATNRRVGQEVMRQSVDADGNLLPYADLMVYPDSYPDITRRRGSGDVPQNQAARDRLEDDLKELTADHQGLEQVLNFLRDNMRVNIFVNWTALKAAGIERTTPVSLNLKEVPFRKALTTVLVQVSTAKAQLAYTIDDGIITISTKEDLSSSKYQIVRVFDVRDLVAPRANDARTRDQLVTALIASIKSSVAPDTWRDAGGTIGSVRELNGQLIVNQTVENQRAIDQYLLKTRTARGLGEVENDLFGVGDDRPTTSPASAPTTAAATSPATVPTIRPGDRLRISIYELITPGLMWTGDLTIDAQGSIEIPNFGKISVAGRTPQEIPARISEWIIREWRGSLPPGTPRPQVSAELLGPATTPATSPASAPATTRAPTLDQLQPERERIFILYSQAKNGADDALRKQQFQQARAQAEQALDLINQNPRLFSDIESAALRDAAQQQLDRINSQRRAYIPPATSPNSTFPIPLAPLDKSDVSLAPASDTSPLPAQYVRRQKVASLVADARKLYDAQQYREAADLLRQATVIDPQDENAALFLRLVITKIVAQQYEEIQHRTGQEVMRQDIDSTEHLIPYADLLVGGSAPWPEITRVSATAAAGAAPLASATTPATQVFIKALLASTSDPDAILFQVPASGPAAPATHAASQPAGTNLGAKIGLLEPRLTDSLRALAAKNDLTVLSRPYMLMNNNQTGQIQIGQQIPASITYVADAAAKWTPKIEYATSGLSITATPHINPDGLVTLDVKIAHKSLLRTEESPAPGTPPELALKNTKAIFNERTDTTRVAIRNDETIIIAWPDPETPADKPPRHVLLFLTPHVALQGEKLDTQPATLP